MKETMADLKAGLRGTGAGEAARSHWAAGRPIYVGDPAYPGQVVRWYPDGRRELMELDHERGELVVVTDLEPRPLPVYGKSAKA